MPWWRVAVDHGVHGAVDVQQHPVVAAPVGQARVGAEAPGEEVVHDDRHAELLGVLGALVHLLGRGRGHVEVVALPLARLGLGLADGLRHEREAVAPAHEGLRVHVLVVLREVEAAAQALVDGAAVVLGRQAQLGLDGAAQQRAAVLVHLVALDLDAVGRAAAGHHVGDGEAHVLQAQRPDGLEAEDVAHQRGEDVHHGPFLEEVDGVGDEGVEAGVVAGDVLDAVGAALVVLEVGEEVRPHRGPGAGGRLGGHGRGGLLAVDARLRRDLEAGQEVRVLHVVVGLPVRVAVFLHAGAVGLGGWFHVRLLDGLRVGSNLSACCHKRQSLLFIIAIRHG